MDFLMQKLQRDGNLVGLKMRPARALIGWMPERVAQVVLGVPEALLKPLPDQLHRVRQAHAAVMSRPTGVDQTRLLSDLDDRLRQYLAETQEGPGYKQYISGGYSVRIVNLNKLCALQPVVHTDYSDHSDGFGRLLQEATQEDMLSLIKITLPIPAPAELPVHFDQKKNAWIMQSGNPQIRVVKEFSARTELAPGLFGTAYGFCIASLPSFVQVKLYRGRYFLTDGYHRSLALLQKGITHIPVMDHEIPQSENLNVAGRFADATILGPHPPLFSDYLRDDVSAAVSQPSPQKTIMIQSAENMTWGE